MMKKIILLTSIAVIFAFCKGPGSGPLVKESFDKENPHHGMGGSEKHQARVITSKTDVRIEPCADCITIAKLLEGKKDFEGKKIRVKGQVTKFNAEIMGKNWIHIQDGTESSEGYDLTVTTNITAAVGDIVTLEGKIALDRDFGYGYKYNILMEDARSVE